jgi:alanine dehydrogenase
MAKEKPSETNMSILHEFLPAEEMLEVVRQKKKLVIGIPKENYEIEKRVPLTPEAVEILINNGHDVIIETKAGEGANYANTRYSDKGAQIVDTRKEVFQADIVIKVSSLSSAEIDDLKGNQVLFTSLNIQTQSEEIVRKLMHKKVTAIAFETIKDEYNCYPIVRSLSAIAGNTAIIIASDLLSNHNNGKGVMLGGISGITPAEVVILGSGTAAEFAARASLGLGCHVRIFDNSIHKMERLQRNLNQRLYTSIFHPQVMEKALASADVLIGAMNLLEKGPQFYISEEMVKSMKKGSVIVDISVDQGGCVETSEFRTQNNPEYVKHGVVHYSACNLTSRVARTASIAISNVISPLLLNLASSGGLKAFLKDSKGTRHGVYIYNGILVSDFIGHRFNIPSKDIDLLMAAF